mmetsp:Transcript_50158/g.125075  ORF Transcript_50158/g.125075 Transcript_50158/m.125075 type:complete len:496 (+) Transcript_50158:56-1543(+)
MDQGTVDFLINYEGELRGMTRPDKGIINSLTMLAADNQENYRISFGIVQTIEQCIRGAPSHLKLVPIYLMDSIVKNVGGTYTRMFMQNLSDVFSEAFAVVDNKLRESFIKLLDTWRTQNVFPSEKNEEIRARLTRVLTSVPPPSMAGVHQQQVMGQAGGSAAPRGMNVLGNLHHPQQQAYGGAPVQEQRLDWQQQMQQQLGGSLVPPPQQQYPSQYGDHSSAQQQAWNTGQPHRLPSAHSASHPIGAELALQGAGGPSPFSQLLESVQQHIRSKSPDLGRAEGEQLKEDTKMPPPARAPSPLAPRVLKATELETRDVGDVIKSMYQDHPFQCKSDGRRFKSKEELEKHLDRLFSINKARKDCTGVKERHWFSTAQEWCLRAEGNDASGSNDRGRGSGVTVDVDAKSRAEVIESVVHADDFEHGVRCAACNEPLKRVYDSEEDIWVFRGCVRVGAGGQQDPAGRTLVHVGCFQPGSSLSPLSTPASTIGWGTSASS